MKLVSCVTGEEIQVGRTLRVQTGAAAGQAWKYERIAPRPDGVHHVHASRPGGKLGRIHREFHPGAFECEITVEITWRKSVSHAAYRTSAKVDDYLLAGLFALVPLAFFEHYHWSEHIVAMFGR
ncbi:hypothetical protein ACQF4J_46880 (plasmid) [Streptomyces sp. C1-1]|uniref:hypothetical protein n=1 Tax=Streptomyces sp. C1-1 TaxID=3231173 RepID=UPI003D0331E8